MTTLHRNQSVVTSAFERVSADLWALPESEIRALNVDVEGAVQRLRLSISNARRHLPTLTRLPNFEPDALLRLADYATVLQDAHARCRVVAPPSVAPDLEERARRSILLLREDIKALCFRGLLPTPQRMKQRGKGLRQLSLELMLLGSLVRENWHVVQGKSAITREQLQEAEDLSTELVNASLPIGAPGQAERELRDRAFTIVVVAYEQLRTALGYIRRHQGDADVIAPSLYSLEKCRSRARRSRSSESSL